MTIAPGLRTGWNRFWFASRSTAPIEVFRIVFGLLVLAWMLSMAPVMTDFFGTDRAVPQDPKLPAGAWTVLSLAPGTAAAWILWVLGTLAALALTVGFTTRLAAVVIFVVVMSLTRQSAWVFNAGDSLIRVMAFYMMLMPAGSALSVDRWRSDPAGVWTFPRRAPWALRLAQIQVSVIYLSTVWEKSGGATWRDGSAVSIAMRVLNVNRLPAPAFITDSVGLVQLMTFGTLAIEASLGILVWNRVARPWVLGLGVLLHLSIDASLMIGFFSFAMLTLYLTFLPPRTAERLVTAVRTRVGRRRARDGVDTPPPDADAPESRVVPESRVAPASSAPDSAPDSGEPAVGPLERRAAPAR